MKRLFSVLALTGVASFLSGISPNIYGAADESVDAPLFRAAGRIGGRIDIARVQPGERADCRPFDFLRDGGDRGVIARRRGGKAGFDHIDVQPRQLARDHQLAFGRHGEAGRLLAVAQGGVEYADMADFSGT